MAGQPSTLPQRLPLEQMQVRWAAIIEPALRAADAVPVILENVALAVGANVVPHCLGRKLVGWEVIRMRSAFSQVYDQQDSNPTPELTLVLNASVAVVVDIKVF